MQVASPLSSSLLPLSSSSSLPLSSSSTSATAAYSRGIGRSLASSREELGENSDAGRRRIFKMMKMVNGHEHGDHEHGDHDDDDVDDIGEMWIHWILADNCQLHL